ncbi:MAG: sensor histidine kinase [Aeromicrobium sp.]|nr:sensor histidine kinase [Burkholderiales bacterium]
MPLSSTSISAWVVRQRRWLIIAMLLSLHFAVLSQVHEGPFSRIWLLVHFGLFLIWQPFVSAERELNVIAVALLLGITAVLLYTLAGWMFVAWIAILISIMGGKVFTLQAARRSRFYLVAVFYLFAILLAWTVPVSLLGLASLPEGIRTLAAWVIPLVLVAMVFLPFRPEDESSVQVFDFFYSTFVLQLVVVIVLGSLASMPFTSNQYFPAVLLTVLSFAGALLFLAILWGPRGGFGGLRTYFSRYLMTVGMPFELWMRRIAEFSETEMSSSRFLTSAMDEVATLPWTVGARWRSPDGEGRFGRESEHVATFRHHGLEITFFTEIDLSPALFLHVRLLAQVIGEFYEGKRREQAMKQNAYMQAVHETGARLTHDIKNLLQSLFAITSASIASSERMGQGELLPRGLADRRSLSPFDEMLQRQLPQLTHRLQNTLDKLRNPAIHNTDVLFPAADWWRDAALRHANAGVDFRFNDLLIGNVPANVFDTVLENCLENARKKRDREPSIQIIAELTSADSPTLLITVTGSAIPEHVRLDLFKTPVNSMRDAGLGIGLFQACRHADDGGYELTLERNVQGCVQFRLAAKNAT